MTDRLMSLANHPLGGKLVKLLGLPSPVPLARNLSAYSAHPLSERRIAIFGRGYAHFAIEQALLQGGAKTAVNEGPLNGIVFDASGLNKSTDLNQIYQLLQGNLKRLLPNGRLLIVAQNPQHCEGIEAAAIARGLEGFIKSIGKEIGKRGATANLVYVQQNLLSTLQWPILFFMGERCTYVSGQAINLCHGSAEIDVPNDQVLKGKTALVTGAARGIGAETAARLAQEGAKVICLDVPQAEEALNETSLAIGGLPFLLDISAKDSDKLLAEFLRKQGGVDIVIHNAGITRDKTFANMPEHFWQQVMSVNLAAIMRINSTLLGENILQDNGRIVCLSSISGIAGNFGQSNYALSKAALIGYVEQLAGQLNARGITINAVAPGFIETPMTAQIPFMTREFGRRLNSLKQGGQPRDVAELICMLSSPGAFGISGNTVRVCGQALLGA